MKQILYIFLIISLTLLGCSHDKGKFSEKNISDSLSIYFDLANQNTISYEKRLNYANKAYEILKNQTNDSLHRKNLFKVANRYYNIKNYEKYKNVTSEVLKKSTAENDTLDTAKAYRYLGDYHSNKTEKDSAYYYYKKAERIYLKLDSKINLATIYINIAAIQAYEHDYFGSEQTAIKVLDLLQEINDIDNEYEAYNVIAIIACELKDYDRAIEYHMKALDIARENNLEESRLNSLNNIGYVYQNQNKDLQAIEKFEEALNDTSITYRLDLQAILTDNLAYSKFKLNDHSELPDLFYKSLKIRDSLNFIPGIIYSKIHLSEFYEKQKEIIAAQNFAKEAYILSKKSKNHRACLVSLKQLINVDPNNASHYSREHIKLSDSLQLAERRAKDKFARINFETDEYISQNDKLNEQNRKIILAGIIVVLLGALIFVVKSQRSKNKEALLKQKQQKANEEIYQLILDQQIQFNEGREKEKKRIAKELHDGIMNKLAGIRFNLFILEKKTDPQTISKCIDHVSEIQHVEKEIRNIAHDLHQDVFASKNDYAELLKTLVGNLDEIAELKIYLELDPKINWEIIPAVIKMHIYRILQEAINNSIKHSHAEIVTVTVIALSKTLAIEIRDNGLGFDTQKESDSLGIKNMKYRTAEIKGNFKIDSSDKGTNLLITIPIEI